MVDPIDKANQVLRLRIENLHLNGLVVSMTDDSMMVATTLRELPEGVEPGALVQGEMPRPDGLYVFATRIRGMQLAPVLVMILDRPKALRKVQRRGSVRHETGLDARVLFISAELSLNLEVSVTNLAFGGLGLKADKAVPVGFHCIVLLRDGEHEILALCRVIHSEGAGGSYHMGMAFVEMSRDDQERLAELIESLEERAEGR